MIPEEVRNLVKDVLKGESSVPVTLYLNADNAMIQRLSKMPATEDTQMLIQQSIIMPLC
jgi:hypothetical protein